MAPDQPPAPTPAQSSLSLSEHPGGAEGEDPSITRERVIRLAFGGDRDRYEHFLDTMRESIPPDVSVILRGSAVTGKRWEDGAPFDAEGPGTSDLDLTFVGGGMVSHFKVHYIPGLHTAPLSDASPTFIPLRNALNRIAGRPVNVQASADVLQVVRDVVMNQPYFTMLEKRDAPGEETA
jgi:hypothetical protein